MTSIRHFFIGIAFLVACNLPSRAWAQDCEAIDSALSAQMENLQAAQISLEVLLSGAGDAVTPLAALFKISLDDDNGVAKRLSELANAIDPASVMKVQEFEKFLACARDRELKKRVETLANLQAEVNVRKKSFLLTDKQTRERLVAAYQANRDRIKSEAVVADQLSGSQAALQAAQANLTLSEKRSSDSLNQDSEPLRVAEALVDQYVVDLESENIRFINELKEKKEELNQLRDRLNKSLKDPKEEKVPDLSSQYLEVRNIWASAADHLFSLHKQFGASTQLSDPVKVEAAHTGEPEDVFLKYDKKFNDALVRKDTLLRSRSDLLNEVKAQNFKLLSDAGTLRAHLLTQCDLQSSCQRPVGLESANIKDIVREIQVVPLRLFAGVISRWLDIKGKVNGGWDGWVDIIKQAITLVFLFLIPFFLSQLLRLLTEYLDRFRERLLARSMLDYRQRTRLAMAISRVNPFVPSVGMIVAILTARRLIETTDLLEISDLLFYFQLYYIYRLVRIFVKIGLEIIFSTGSVDKIKNQHERIERTSARLSRLYFLQFGLLHLIEDTVRKALVYHLVSTVVFWVTAYVVILEFRNWRVEITDSFAFRYPKAWQRIRSAADMRFGAMLLPVFLLAVVASDLFNFLSVYLLRIDVVKRFLAEVLRRKLERVESNARVFAHPPAEYLAYFDYYLPAKDEFFVNLKSATSDSVAKIANTYAGRPAADDLVIVIGNRGMGKTTVLKRAFESVDIEEDRKFYSQVPARVTTSAGLYAWLTSCLRYEVKSVECVRKLDASLTKPIFIFVDDIHNLFLGAIGGFEAYRLFIDVISLETKNIFWCLTVNSRAWTYLTGVFGAEHFYGRTVRLTTWADTEIQSLILSRHQLTGFRRTFDDSIRAYGAGDSLGQQAEAQFFRLLWGQSRGNPRSALMYWVSAITSPDAKSIHVGVPGFVSTSLVDALSDDALFLLAAIARQESLNFEEMRTITGIEGAVIRKCIKEVHDKKLVWTDDYGRVRILSKAQYVVDYYLIGKNFLYE